MPLATLALALAMRPSPVAPPELLRLKPVVGQRLEFGLRFSLEFVEPDGKEAGKVDASLLLAERVLAVEGERVQLRRYLRLQRIEGEGEAGEEIAALFAGLLTGEHPAATDLRARKISISDDPTSAQGSPAMNTVDVTLPEGPVSIGDRWTGSYGAGGEMKLRYTLRGIAPVGARRVALIALDQEEPSASGYTLAPGGLFALDLADGRWLRTRAGFVLVAGGRRVTCRYEIARTGAPEWPVLLAAFPGPD